MKVLIQRVLNAKCVINNQEYSSINEGMLIFVGYTNNDSIDKNIKMADKLSKLRIFEDSNSKMNLNIKDVNKEIMVISQFTLYGNTSEGNRPSFSNALNPKDANELYLNFIDKLKSLGLDVKTGVFREDMKIHLVNDGPCSFIIEI